MGTGISFGRRLTQLAEERRGEIALVFAGAGGEQLFEWDELDRRANQTARMLAEHGVTDGDVVVVGLQNSPEHVFATFGAWKLGASVLPLRAELPAWERDRMLSIAAARVVIGDWSDAAPGTLTSQEVKRSSAFDPSPLTEDHVPRCSRLVATSGSTGTPKIIVTSSPGLYSDTTNLSTAVNGFAPHFICMAASPLYHTNGFAYCYPPLLNGNRVVLMEHFDAEKAVDLIERHRVTVTVLVPTMLARIAKLPGVRERDFSSLERVIYGGASLPEWVARTWLDLVPPENFMFVYGGSEVLGICMCTGKEWLERFGVLLKELVDGDGFVANSKVRRQRARVINRTCGGILARHSYRGDVLLA